MTPTLFDSPFGFESGKVVDVVVFLIPIVYLSLFFSCRRLQFSDAPYVYHICDVYAEGETSVGGTYDVQWGPIRW